MNTTSSIVQLFEGRNPFPPLCPKDIWTPELSEKIKEMSAQELTGIENPSQLAVKTTRSCLFLWNDDLYASHAISQDIPEAIGSYLHGIMHRREGDFSNAKYWFRQVDRHPIYKMLYEQVSNTYPQLSQWKQWDSFRFIDEIEEVITNEKENGPFGELLRKLQVLEMSLLLQYCLKQ